MRFVFFYSAGDSQRVRHICFITYSEVMQNNKKKKLLPKYILQINSHNKNIFVVFFSLLFHCMTTMNAEFRWPTVWNVRHRIIKDALKYRKLLWNDWNVPHTYSHNIFFLTSLVLKGQFMKLLFKLNNSQRHITLMGEKTFHAHTNTCVRSFYKRKGILFLIKSIAHLFSPIKSANVWHHFTLKILYFHLLCRPLTLNTRIIHNLCLSRIVFDSLFMEEICKWIACVCANLWTASIKSNSRYWLADVWLYWAFRKS